MCMIDVKWKQLVCVYSFGGKQMSTLCPVTFFSNKEKCILETWFIYLVNMNLTLYVVKWVYFKNITKEM